MEEIFSGEYSKKMWEAINTAETVEDIQDALYFVCCRIQELESKYDNLKEFKTYRRSIKHATRTKNKYRGIHSNL